ncbi:MAG: zinc-ribbon domain-containing protein [Muribaculaceae bacterium]|nr:zinc-ribbon domain-containing protein [Muribaculaceae bacterium]
MKFCPKCGNKLNDSAKFCKECGTKVESSITESSKLSNMDNTDKDSQDDNESPSPISTTKSSNSFFWIICAGIFVYIILSPRFLCDIDPYEEYGFLDAIWHGLFIIPNWIFSLFSDVVYKAENQSGIYNFFFWGAAICVLGYVAFYLITIIVSLLIPDDKKED